MRQTTPDVKPNKNDEMDECENSIEGETPAICRIATPSEQKMTCYIRFRWAEREAIKLIKERNKDYYSTLFEKKRINSN